MTITPSGNHKAQVNQGSMKNESFFDSALNKLLRKIAITGTAIEKEQPKIDPQLQSATASPQLTDPARNINVPQQPMEQSPTEEYPSAPGSIDALPSTQREVANLLIQKAKEQGLLVDNFQPRVKNFDFQDGNVINISIVNSVGAKVKPR